MTDSEWCPPSEDIQRLFTFDNHLALKSDLGLQNADIVKKSYFTEEELSKLSSTLAKIVRRTDALLAQNDIARKHAIETHNELKSIQSLVMRHAKKYLKDADVASETIGNKSDQKGFRKPCKISEVMCEFMKIPLGSSCSRVEVNNFITKYIKDHQLIDPKNAQIICPDDKLWTILSENARGSKITYFSLQKYIKQHFLKTAK